MHRAPDGGFECAQCGEHLDIKDTTGVLVVFTAGGGKQTERVLSIDGREFHRCPYKRDKNALPSGS